MAGVAKSAVKSSENSFPGIMNINKLLKILSKKDNIILFLFIFLFLAMRLWTLLTGIFMSHEDELYNGTITREILKGLKIPLFDYHSEPYAGGTLVVGILAVPFFFIFGNSYFSLKLVALTLSLGSLIICFILLKKHFSLKVATIASLLFIFPPSLYADSSLITLGNHCESIFFILLTTFLFFEIFFKGKDDSLGDKKISYFLIFLFGLVSGFSLYFAYIYLYTLLTCFSLWFVFDRKFFLKKYFLIYCLSFLAGFIPWLYYNITHSFQGIRVMAERYVGGTEKKIPLLVKAGKYFLFDIPYILNFHHIKISRIATVRYLFSLLLLISFLYVIWKSRKSFWKIVKTFVPIKSCRNTSKEITKESFFIISFIFFSLIYLSSNYVSLSGDIEPYLGHRHLVPLFPIFFIVIALFISRLIDDKKILIKILGYLILTPFLFLGFISNTITPSHYNQNPVLPIQNLDYYFTITNTPSHYSTITYRDLDGFSYKSLGLSAYRRFGMDLDKYLEQGEKIDPDYRHFYYLGLGDVISGRGLVWKKGFEEYEGFENKISKIDVRYQSYYYEGTGYKVGNNAIYNQYQMPVTDMKRIPKKKRDYAYLGMAMALVEKKLPETNTYEIVNAIDKKYRRFFYPLLGKEIMKRNEDIKKTIVFIESLSTDEKEGIYRGLGLTLFDRADFDITKFDKMISPFPESSRVFLYEAAGEIIGFIYRNSIKKLHEIPNQLSEPDKQSIFKGIGRFAAERYGFDPVNCNAFINAMPSQYNIFCYEGLGKQIAFRFGGDLEGANSIIDKSSPEIQPFIKKGFSEEMNILNIEESLVHAEK